jgi:hypothetical protein
MTLTWMLAQATSGGDGAVSYRPFISPLPLWEYWYLLILPLCLAVSIVYKAMKLPDMKLVPRQALMITVWIIVCMVLAGAGLTVIVKIM